MITLAGSHVILVQMPPGPSELTIRVGQYELDSLDALGAKLAQYPPGTVFTMNLDALDVSLAARIAAELPAIARAAGQVLTSR